MLIIRNRVCVSISLPPSMSAYLPTFMCAYCVRVYARNPLLQAVTGIEKTYINHWLHYIDNNTNETTYHD